MPINEMDKEILTEGQLYNKLAVPVIAPCEDLKHSVNKRTSSCKGKNFRNGLHNARQILKGLERSLCKTKKYEARLLQCKSGHSHRHDVNNWWEENTCEDLVCRDSKTGTTKSTSQVEVPQSWPTVSIVCLQYQFEELSKRYKSLLQAYNERCSTINNREMELSRLHQRVRAMRAQLAHAHKTLLDVGERYMTVREKGRKQKLSYEEKMSELQRMVQEVMTSAVQARVDLDNQVAAKMAAENDGATSLLLAEIRKCNKLYLENLKLKAQIEEITPGQVNW